MAKKNVGKSMADFETENLLNPVDEDEETQDQEEVEQEDEEEIEEEKPKKVSKKEPAKKVTSKKTAKAEPEEEPGDEDEPIEELAKKAKKGIKAVQDTEDEPEEVEEEPAAPEDFWGAVEKITGNSVDVDFGDIDPISPQGVAIREKALQEKAVDDFLDNLQAKQPKVYKAFEHAMAGGSIEDLFTPGEKDYSKVVIKEDDEEHAKQVLREYYQKRNITNEGRIQRMITADEESEEGLIKQAQGALQEMKLSQETDQKEKLEQQKIRAQRQAALDDKMIGEVETTINSLQLASFKIPTRKEAEEFSSFVRKSLQRDGSGGYLFITPIEPGNLEKQLQTEYFRFKKGDLDKLITTKAITKNTEALKLRIQKEKEAPKTTIKEATGKQVRSMKEYEVD